MAICYGEDGVTAQLSDADGNCPVGFQKLSGPEAQEWTKNKKVIEDTLDLVEKQEDRYASLEKFPLYQNTGPVVGLGDDYFNTRNVTQTATIADFVNVPQKLLYTNPEQLINLSDTLNAAGFTHRKKDKGGRIDYKAIQKAWVDHLEQLSDSEAQFEPYEALNFLEVQNAALGDIFGKGKAGGTGSGGTRYTINLTNESDAEVLVNGALNTYLGRDATDEELDNFYTTLNKKERKNPTKTVTGGRRTESSGGINTELEAQKFAETREDYADVQAQTTFKGLIEQAVRSRMSGDML